ncbi:MAG TPA: class I SAM-dependent methyltransferase [Thermoplasmata archaeon]|nr:class I SAM-dependent methyltransferase [Thermoplasmata archaeon]
MSTRKAQRDFDTISAVYDETRQPLDDGTIERLLDYLRRHAWNSVLEVGVGTGRIARPLMDGGFRLVGLDASRGMLSRARAKGVPDLVHGTAYRLPFSDRTFDTALFVHVLHILDDAGAGLREATRVSRGGVLAVMDRGPEDPGRDAIEEASPRELLRKELAALGYPDLLRPSPRLKEREILRAFPPKEIHLLSDREVTEPLSRPLDTIEKRGYRHVLDVPPDLLARAVAAARARVGSRTTTYRRRESVVWWANPEPG